MSVLSSTAPSLKFDREELQKWGYVWRIGTKVRRAQKEEEDDTGEEVDGDPIQAGLDALEDAEAEPASSAKQRAKAAIAALTAEGAGMPEELRHLVDEGKKYPSAFTKKQGMDFGLTFDRAVGEAIATMLGGIKVAEYKGSSKASSLQPPEPNCVEVGPARIIGGVRPQNFDVAYRPDGVRIAYDSKTLNDAGSIQKNWQNMVNDLATEATTVHTRFPYAIVGFIVAVPRPALRSTQQADMIRTLERMATRTNVIDQAHLAEAIAFVVWDPETGEIDATVPPQESNLRWEKFMPKVHHCYSDRYKGLPPHDK